MIRLSKLTKVFRKRTVLNSLELSVERGERIALVGSNGAGSFRYRPTPTACAPGVAPPQRFSNIASWGDATILVGSTAPDCVASLDGSVLTARLLTDGERLHRDGFE